MGLRLSNALRGVGVGGAGAIWGLGLARLLAETALWPLLYGSPLAVAGVSLCCAALMLALDHRLPWLARPSGLCGESPPGRPASLPLATLIPLSFPLLYVIGLVASPLAGGVLLLGGGMLALLIAVGDRRRWLPPVVLGLAVFALYVRTLLPGVGQADTFEFQTVVPLLRVAHPTGYPLYVLLGKLFTWLPVGSVAWRVNLASAVFATAAVMALYGLLFNLSPISSVFAGERGEAKGGRWLPPFLAALAFACSSTLWSQAVVAEVYALHNLIVSLILWLLLAPPRVPAARRWQAVFLLVGLGCANHLTTALLTPAVALALLWERPRLRVKDWLIAGLGLLGGLSIYLFVLLRWPALNQGEWMTAGDFFTYVTGGQFHRALRFDGWRDPVRWGIVWRLLRGAFGWAGLGLAATGAAGLALCGRRALALTGVTLVAFVLYGLDYYVPDISVFVIPAHLMLAIWIGAGMALVADLPAWLSAASRFLERRAGDFALRLAAETAVLLSALLPLSLVWLNLPAVDQSHHRGREGWGRYVLNLPLAAGSAVLSDMEAFAPLYYLQQIEGLRPDLEIVVLADEASYRADLAARLGRGQTVYLARYLPHLEGFSLRSVGPLVEVNAALPEDPPPEAEPVGATFGEAITLAAFDMQQGQEDDAPYRLTLYWRTDAVLQDNLEVRFRLVDGAGQVGWVSAGAQPVDGLYPTNAWPVGVVIADYHEIAPPPWLARGEYRLDVGLFPPFGETGLPVGGQATSWLTLNAIPVAPPADPAALPYMRRCSFDGGAWLTGYDMAGEAVAGAPFAVDLSWRGVETGERVRLTWGDAQGRALETAEFPVVAGAPRSRHIVAAPLAPGNYVLRVGLVGRSARCGWLVPLKEDGALASIAVQPAQEGLANFAGLVLLLDAEVRRTGAHPGDVVPVVLRWRALRAMDEDYTVFVQLIGPDGRLHGQVDAWPMQGTRPTSGWSPGEELSDPYEVRLAFDAPPGRYQVLVGWYLLATMERLRVVDDGGRPIGDGIVVGEIQVGPSSE